MKRIILLALLTVMGCAFTGCSLVACDRVFPKLTWYWSSEAKRCRATKQWAADVGKESDAYSQEAKRAKARYESSTNEVTHP